MLARLTRERFAAHKALEGGDVFFALSDTLQTHPGSLGVVRGVCETVANLLADNLPRRSLVVEAKVPEAIVASAKANAADSDALISILKAIVRIHHPILATQGSCC